MHWTAFLAYRRFPENARVVDDLACIQCGYNLRQQMVRSRCPECGLEVGNSIFLLARPELTARALRAAGPTYLTPLLLMLWCLNWSYWPMLIVSGALALGGVFRLWAVSELRFKASLSRLPVLGTRLHLWWLVTLIELMLAVAWLAAVLVVANSISLRTGATGNTILRGCLLAWWCIAMLGVLLAGRFGAALMDMLGYSWTRIEFRVQQIVVLIAIALFPLTLLGLQFVSSSTMAYLLLVAALAQTLAPHVQTAVALLHAATAAETSSETWDDVLDSERVALVPQASLPSRPEPPAIKID